MWLFSVGLALAEAPPPIPALRVSFGDPVILGALDRSLILEELEEHHEALAGCLGLRSPAVGVTVRFTIPSSGHPRSVSFEAPILASDEVQACVASTIEQMDFPQCKCGGIVLIRSLQIEPVRPSA